MNFKGFLAEISGGLDFTPVVTRIDGVIQRLKKIEPAIDNPLFLYSRQKVGGREDVLQFFINALFEMREFISRNVREKGLLRRITPLYQKFGRDCERLEQKSEDTNRAMIEFNIPTVLFQIYEMISDMTKGKPTEPE